jgi:hypothetical protein
MLEDEWSLRSLLRISSSFITWFVLFDDPLATLDSSKPFPRSAVFLKELFRRRVFL